MKLDTFATLQAVIRHGSLSGAAAEMHLTASAVSMQMKQLEAYFGQPLFDRSGQQLRPTPLAEEACRLMGDTLAQLQALREVSQLAVRGVMTVGILESMLPALLPPTLAHARERHPQLEIRMVSGRTVALTAAVKAGELDAALVAQPEDGGSSRLLWHPMERREMVLVAPPGSQEDTLAGLFARYEWIRYDRKTISGALAKRHVEATQLPTRVLREFDSAAAILSMVSAGLGVSVLEISEPGLLAAYPVRVLSLGANAPTYQLALAVRKADADKRTLAALQEVLGHALTRARQRRQLLLQAGGGPGAR
nr:LysR substrate-binding domain-containing protein [Variovorax boronicumulans]